MNFIYPSQPVTLINIKGSVIQGLAANPNWIAEPKYNGFRCIIVTDEVGKPKFYGRDGQVLKNCNYDFKLTPNSIYDSEWMFKRIAHPNYKDKFYIFDMYVQNGIHLDTTPLYERKKRIQEDKNLDQSMIYRMPYVNGDASDPKLFEKLYEDYCKEVELEGIVIKKFDQIAIVHRARPVDNPHWIKVRQSPSLYETKKMGGLK